MMEEKDMKEFTARTHDFMINLDEGLKRYPIGSLFAVGDDKADSFRLILADNGDTLDLTGCTVTGYFIRADQVTVRNTGNAVGSIAEVTLEKACYVAEGAFSFAVNIRSAEGISRTVAVFDGRTVQTQTDNIIVDEGTVVPDLDDLLAQIEAMEKATAEAEAIAQKLPFIGTNGNWYVWDENTEDFADTGIPARGEKGEPGEAGADGKNGADGVSVTNAVINTSGRLIITLSSGSTIDAGAVSTGGGGSGADGVGIQSIAKTATNGLIDTYTITLTNGAAYTFDVTNGYSPTVAVEDITGGHRVTVTDVNGAQSFDVMDGAAGSGGTTASGEWETPVLYTGASWQADEEEPVQIKRAGDIVCIAGCVSRASGIPSNGTIKVFAGLNAKYMPATKRRLAIMTEAGAIELEVRPAENSILVCNRTDAVIGSGKKISLACCYAV